VLKSCLFVTHEDTAMGAQEELRGGGGNFPILEEECII